MSHDEIVNFVSDLYKRMPNVKAYLDLAYSNKYDAFIEKNRKKLERYLYPTGGDMRIRDKEARELIKEINRMEIPEVAFQLELYYVEYATEVIRDFGFIDSKFYSSIISTFQNGIHNINKIGGYDKFETRINEIITNAFEQDIELEY